MLGYQLLYELGWWSTTLEGDHWNWWSAPLQYIGYNFQDDSCIEISKRTNEYTVPELDTQAKKIINKRDASSVIIELNMN